jgi:hypothetical protein
MLRLVLAYCLGQWGLLSTAARAADASSLGAMLEDQGDLGSQLPG